MLTLLPPVSPFRGFRGIDAFGAGGFAAPRDGGSRPHAGVDLVAVSGDLIVAPCALRISHIGIAYPDADLASLHLDGIADASGFFLKLLYAKPGIDTIVGSEFSAGDSLGFAQSVAGYWMAQRPARGTMVNHVHLELREQLDGVAELHLLDPTPYLATPKAA